MTQDFALFCNPESRRVEFFSTTLGRQLRQKPLLIPWLWILRGEKWQDRLEQPPQFLRLESPGRNWAVEKEFLCRGAGVEDEEASPGWSSIDAQTLRSQNNDPGRLFPMRQWFLGWRKTLRELSTWAQSRGLSAHWVCPPEDVERMFDKAACQKSLESSGVAVAPALGVPRCFDEVWELMNQSGRKRVFLKPCHGSSASGVVALEAARRDLQAFSTTELVETVDGLRLYNSRNIITYRGAAEVRRLVDAVCAERCLLQVWIPKAGLFDHPFDLRVVVIGGQARNTMLRLGRGPMTNSQLLGGKGDVETLRCRMGQAAWRQMLDHCECAMATAFPRSLYAGFDVLVEPNFRTTWILEANAFGDLLPRTLHEGKETYDWEIQALQKRNLAQVSSTGA